ncbi:MAG: AzlD domain-containing protein [Thermomicrobiales bacterium]|nr:AzlD domain-containing protein [Thermomicrobiales bacterium]
MSVHSDTWLIIATMAAITYGFRAGGYWLMGRVKLSPRLESGLSYLPGAVITALVIPAALEVGTEGIIGVIVVGIAMRWRGNLLISLVLGVGTVWALRQVM